jgi:hypothetical protein
MKDKIAKLITLGAFLQSIAPAAAYTQNVQGKPSEQQVREWTNTINNPQSEVALEELLGKYMYSNSANVWETVPKSGLDCVRHASGTYLAELMQVGSGHGDFVAETDPGRVPKQKGARTFGRDYSTTWAGAAGMFGMTEETLKWTISINNGISVNDIEVLKDRNGVIYDAVYRNWRTDKSRKDVVCHPANDGNGVYGHILWEPGKSKYIPLFNALYALGYFHNLGEQHGSGAGTVRQGAPQQGTPRGTQDRQGNQSTKAPKGFVSDWDYTMNSQVPQKEGFHPGDYNIKAIWKMMGNQYFGGALEVGIAYPDNHPLENIALRLGYARDDSKQDFNLFNLLKKYDEARQLDMISIMTKKGNTSIAIDQVSLDFTYNRGPKKVFGWELILGAAVDIVRQRTLGDIYRHTEFRDENGNVIDPQDLPAEKIQLDNSHQTGNIYSRLGAGVKIGPFSADVIWQQPWGRGHNNLDNEYNAGYSPRFNNVVVEAGFNFGYFMHRRHSPQKIPEQEQR